jgi:hypothetical protein
MSTPRGLLIALAMTVVLVLTCDPADAINLEGTWQGKLTCTTQDQHEAPENSSQNVTVQITQFGNDLRLRLGGVHFVGLAVDDGSDVTRGLMAFHACEDSLFTLDGGGRVTIKADDPNGGKITGQATGFGRDSVLICSLQLKRTNANDPNLGPCPVPF